jgi:anaerobic selenocysteine-containing dehydrogenase
MRDDTIADIVATALRHARQQEMLTVRINPLDVSLIEKHRPRLDATGRARFTVHELPRHELEDNQFLMMTMRSHDQFNTTIYGLDDRYRGIYNGRRVVFLNSEDMAEAGLAAGQLVDLTSHFEGEERTAARFVVVPYSIPRRCAATYFPEANVLVPIKSVAEKSNTPASKSVVISLRPSTEAV